MLAEMNKTIKENSKPIGSMIKGKEMWREAIDIKFHWIRRVLFIKIKNNIKGSRIRLRRDQIVSMEIFEVDFNSI